LALVTASILVIPVLLFLLLLVQIQISEKEYYQGYSETPPIRITGRTDLQFQITSLQLSAPKLSRTTSASAPLWERYLPSVEANITSTADVYGGSKKMAKAKYRKSSSANNTISGPENIIFDGEKDGGDGKAKGVHRPRPGLRTVIAREILMDITYGIAQNSDEENQVIVGRIDRRNHGGDGHDVSIAISPLAEVSRLRDIDISTPIPLRPSTYLRLAVDLFTSTWGDAPLYGGHAPGPWMESGRILIKMSSVSRVQLFNKVRLTVRMTCSSVLHVRWWMLLIPSFVPRERLPSRIRSAFDYSPVEIVQELSRCKAGQIKFGWGEDMTETVNNMRDRPFDVKYRENKKGFKNWFPGFTTQL